MAKFYFTETAYLTTKTKKVHYEGLEAKSVHHAKILARRRQKFIDSVLQLFTESGVRIAYTSIKHGWHTDYGTLSGTVND